MAHKKFAILCLKNNMVSLDKWRLLPCLIALYFLCLIDGSHITHATALHQDLGNTSAEYGLLAMAILAIIVIIRSLSVFL